MTVSAIDGVQNVEVSKPIPPEMDALSQLELMEAYTRAHASHATSDKAVRELACLEVIYPALFRSLEPQDLIAGRLDFLPIGFGSVTSVGGVGHYCVFHKLRAFKKELKSERDKARVDALYDYWANNNDCKAIYCADVLDDCCGRFIDCAPAYMATARLSGMLLDYQKLVEKGVGGLQREIRRRLVEDPHNTFLSASLGALELFQRVIDRQEELCKIALSGADSHRSAELLRMACDLRAIKTDAPRTFCQALQLIWLYALCAGCINYGRLDSILGPYLVADLEAGRLSEAEAYALVKSLWTLIENRRTTVNGRVMVGGRGRPNPEAADAFARLCLKVCHDTRYVEPQFTLRFDATTPQDIIDSALDAIGAGATYPTLYNDDVNIPAVMYAMRVDEKTAEQYAPFGCGEFVIQGKSVGTPNTLINLLKLLNIVLNDGIDPFDGVDRTDGVALTPIERIGSFEELYGTYLKLVDHYIERSVKDQLHSYEVLNREVSFLFTSILMDDCLARGKALLDGGVEILGGTTETYGNINTSDALYAIKQLVFDERRYTLKEINDALVANFDGYEPLRRELEAVDKYGNDIEEVDAFANRFYEHVAKTTRQAGIDHGMDYYLIVISNNQTNTDWGHTTTASADGRVSGLYMNPANNPQAKAAKNGPTAVLNSLVHFDARYHGGSVQNIKFTPSVFDHHRAKVKALLKSYFDRGGCQLMVTVVDKGELEDAQVHPELYPDLLVRVAGYSAVFVQLPRDIQDELISRELHEL